MTYKVKLGDTLSKIAEKYGTTVEALVASNGIKNKHLIFPGQVLKIPVKETIKPDAVDIINQCVNDIMALPTFKEFMEMIEK